MDIHEQYPLGNAQLRLVFFIIGAAAATSVYFYYRTVQRTQPWPDFPLIQFQGMSALSSWTNDAAGTIAMGRRMTNDGFFQIMTGNGPKIVAPNRVLEEIKASKELDAHKGLNAQRAFSHEHFWNYSGMIGFKAMREYPETIRHVVRGKVNAAMFAMTSELATEAALGINLMLPSDKVNDVWTPIATQPLSEEIVARLSTFLFLGRDAARDRKWLDLMRSYTFNAFRTSARLRGCFPLLRSLGHRFWFSESLTVRQQCADAEKMIGPMVNQRMEMIAAGQYDSLKVGDALGWLLETSKRYGQRVDCVGAQMLLTFGAVHNTTEALNVAILDLCRHPEIVQLLREEIQLVFSGRSGWSKDIFSSLRLMDSFLKESQRMQPHHIVPLRRIATRRTVLSDGTALPQGAFVTFAGQNMDPCMFREPETFKLDRFLESGTSYHDSSKYTGLSTGMISFGYGSWACPGRYVAVTELKLALCFLLINFDFRADPNSAGGIRHFAGQNLSSKTATCHVRRRGHGAVDLLALSPKAA